MKLTKSTKEVITQLVIMAESQDDDYFEIVDAICLLFPMTHKEQLAQCLKSPTYDGDVISKSERDDLLDMDILGRICMNGVQGHTGAKYIGFSIMKGLKKNKS